MASESFQSEIIYDPQRVPFLGLFSQPHPTRLEPGQFQESENWRAERGVLGCRNGMTRFSNAALASGANLGVIAMDAFTLNGVTNLYAIVNSAASSAQLFQINMTTGAATEMTATSGPYGNTRGIGSGNRVVGWDVVRDKKNGKDYLVVTDDGGYAVVVDPTASAGSRVAGLSLLDANAPSSIPPPKPTNTIGTVAYFPTFFAMSGATMPTYTNSGANLTSASTGASPDNNVRMSVATGVVAGDTTKWSFAALRDFTNSQQLVFLFQTTYRYLLSKLKVEVSIDDANWFTIHDPADPTYTPISGQVDQTYSRTMVAFSLDRLTATVRAGIRYIRFTWVGPAPASAITADFYMLAGSGVCPAYREHAISYFHSGHRGESGALVVANRTQEYVSNLGGRSLDSNSLTQQNPATATGGMRIPFIDGILYNYKVQFQNTSTAVRDAGVDTLRVYAADFGEGQFSYVGETAIASYGGSWAFSSGTEFSVRTYTDTKAYADKQRSLPAPDAYNMCIPYGAFSCISANGRLFVGTSNASNLPSGNKLYVSEADQPFRFTEFPFNDTTSGTVHSLQGGESIYAFAASATSVMGVQNIFAFGTKQAYALSGKTAQTLSRLSILFPHGTNQPGSVCTYKGMVAWMDDLGQIRILSDGIDSPSLGTIEDKLYASWANIRSVRMNFFDDRLYVAYNVGNAVSSLDAPSGLTRMLVYDLRLGAWVGEDVSANSNIRFDELVTIGGTFYFLSSGDMFIYKHETGNDDAGTPISIRLKSREMVTDWVNHVCKRPEIVVDTQNSTWTFTHNYKGETDGTMAYTINLNASTTRAWRISSALPTASSAPVWGWSSSMTVTGTFAPGKNVYGIKTEWRLQTGGAVAG